MVSKVDVEGTVSVDDVINAIIDKMGQEAESLCKWIDRCGEVNVGVTIDAEDAIPEAPDSSIADAYRERMGGVEIEIEREFIDTIKHMRRGEWDIARALFGRMFQPYPTFSRQVEEALA